MSAPAAEVASRPDWDGQSLLIVYDTEGTGTGPDGITVEYIQPRA